MKKNLLIFSVLIQCLIFASLAFGADKLSAPLGMEAKDMIRVFDNQTIGARRILRSKERMKTQISKHVIRFSLPQKQWNGLLNYEQERFKTGESSELLRKTFQQTGIGWLDEWGADHVIKSPALFARLLELLDSEGLLDREDCKRYVILNLRIQRELLLLEQGIIGKGKTVPRFPAASLARDRLKDFPRFSRLLQYYHNQYPLSETENEEETVRQMLGALAADRVLGKTTLMLQDDSGALIRLSEFWPLAQYTLTDALGLIEPRIEQIAEELFQHNPSVMSAYSQSVAEQQGFLKTMELYLQNPTGVGKQKKFVLRHILTLLDPDVEEIVDARDREMGAPEEAVQDYLEIEIDEIRGRLSAYEGRIITQEDLVNLYEDTREELVAIRSFDVFSRIVKIVLEAKSPKTLFSASLGMESLQTAYLRSLNRSSQRIDFLLVAAGLENQAAAEKIGIGPDQVSRWRNGQQKPQGESLLRLTGVLNQYLQRKVDAAMIEYGVPVDEHLRKLDTFGARLYDLRVLAGMTRDELAGLLAETGGFKLNGIEAWEMERNVPVNQLVYYKLARIFNQKLGLNSIDVPMLRYGIGLDEFIRVKRARHELENSRIVVTPGLRLKNLRLSKGLLVKEFAAICKVDESTVHKWENRNVIPIPESARIMLKLFNRRQKTDLFQNCAQTIGYHSVFSEAPIEVLLERKKRFGERLRLVREELMVNSKDMVELLQGKGLTTVADTLTIWEKYKTPPANIRDQFMVYLELYYEQTGRTLDGCLLFRQQPARELLQEVFDWNQFELLVYLREAVGLSKKSLAEKLNVRPRTVGDWERGAVVPGRQTREKISEIFQDSPVGRTGLLKDFISRINRINKNKKQIDADKLEARNPFRSEMSGYEEARFNGRLRKGRVNKEGNVKIGESI